MAKKSDDFRQRLIEQIDALNRLAEMARRAQETATEAANEETGDDQDPEGEAGNDRSVQLREQYQRDLDSLFAAFARVDAAAKSVGAHLIYR